MSDLVSSTGISSDSALANELRSVLERKGLNPSSEWLRTFLASQNVKTPLTALASTASFRILAGDISSFLSQATTLVLPTGISNVRIKEQQLAASSIVVQILDIEDMGRSRWEQIEAMEAIERGEDTKGHQIIRVGISEEDGQEHIDRIDPTGAANSAATTSKGPHKVLVQDAAGFTAYGIEIHRVDGLHLNMSMGAKLLLKGCKVARGIILLEPETVVWLGGKIDTLHHGWMRGKKQRLLAAFAAEAANPNAS